MAQNEGCSILRLQLKAERDVRLAEKKAKKEEERRRKFAKKVTLCSLFTFLYKCESELHFWQAG